MSLFNHEVCDQVGKRHQIAVVQHRKLFDLIEYVRCGLQQIGGRVSDKIYDLEANRRRELIKQLVLGLCNEHIEFTGKYFDDTDPSNQGNMNGWTLMTVVGSKQESQEVLPVKGYSNESGYYIFVPNELVDNPEFMAELTQPKPQGFLPGLSIYESRGIKHLATCEENEICLDCGRPGFPYCDVHDPCGEYWRKTCLSMKT